ncbi:MAG TPA: GNAT family N-acetyltransferase, partial [Chloroflexota bacterium]
MIYTPGKTGVARLRTAQPAELEAVQAVWEASYAEDDPASWSRGGWSVAGWATDTRVLEAQRRIVGVVAVRSERAPDGAMPARVALDLGARQPAYAAMLVSGAVNLIAAAGGGLVRLFVPSRAEWMQNAARAAGFEPVRTVAHMLMPASVATPPGRLPNELRLRAMRDGEDQTVVDALNRNWTGTWNFVEIPLEMLQKDLAGQREGMLLAVDAADRIVATCHAVYEPTEQNPDGNPRAWISNLTVDPGYRQRGVARSMLSAGIAFLRARGATSITLGVDANDPAPFRLYQSVGFQVATSQEAWDKV